MLAKIKANKLAKIILPKTFSLNDYDIEILEQPGIEKGLLKVVIKASKDGKELFIDNPLYFQNPPLMVHDGTKYVEDHQQALKEIIIRVVKITGK